MALSTGRKRIIALLLLFLLVSIAAPFSLSLAGPGNSGEPIPGDPPAPTTTSTEGGDALLALLGLVVDVGTTVVL